MTVTMIAAISDTGYEARARSELTSYFVAKVGLSRSITSAHYADCPLDNFGGSRWPCAAGSGGFHFHHDNAMSLFIRHVVVAKQRSIGKIGQQEGILKEHSSGWCCS